MKVACRHCSEVMTLPEQALNRKARCPKCSATFEVTSTDVILEEVLEGAAEESPASMAPAPIVKRRGPSSRRRRAAEEAAAAEGGFFAPEKKFLARGPLGGIVLMIAAVVWFVVGYAGGYIFYYPPVLFLFGLIGTINALARKSPTRRRH